MARYSEEIQSCMVLMFLLKIFRCECMRKGKVHVIQREMFSEFLVCMFGISVVFSLQHI